MSLLRADQRLWAVLTAVKERLLADADIAAFAQALVNDVDGCSESFTVQIGNTFVESQVPLSMYPFVFIVVGSEMTRVEDTTYGTLIERDIRFQCGFFDPEAERCTKRSLEFEAVLTRSLDRIFGGLYVGPEAGEDGLILGHMIGAVESDYDLYRPLVFRTIPVALTYAE